MHIILPSVVRIDFYTFIFEMRGCGVIPESFLFMDFRRVCKVANAQMICMVIVMS